ncbi:MAG: hypothetical protein IJ317_00790 [Clostridia bacterium]|nr:hypothetical protein [Clostridia bacterium]
MEKTEIKKMESYLGFCIRSGKISFGVDDSEKQKKAFLLIADENLGESSLKTMKKLKDKFGCALLIGKSGLLGELLHKPTVKAVAIKDKNLAEAILSVVSGEFEFKIYSGGNN